jgi:hypothetical protein
MEDTEFHAVRQPSPKCHTGIAHRFSDNGGLRPSNIHRIPACQRSGALFPSAKYDSLEFVSTTAPNEVSPSTAYSSSKKRRLRNIRQQQALRIQAHTASAHIASLSAHANEMARLTAARAIERAQPRPTAPAPVPSNTPPWIYHSAALNTSDAGIGPRPPGEIDAFLRTAMRSGRLPPLSALGL